MQQFTPLLALLFLSAVAQAQAPSVEAPVPPLRIDDRGELLLQGDDFGYGPWTSEQQPGVVHILQYFGATRADSKLFKPLTDRLQENFKRGQYHVTSIINLDAALWGTTGLVVSEVKDSKRQHPHSTLVLDENGEGAERWQLAETGAGLMIVDAGGIVRYFTTRAMSEEDVNRSVELVREQVEACLETC